MVAPATANVPKAYAAMNAMTILSYQIATMVTTVRRTVSATPIGIPHISWDVLLRDTAKANGPTGQAVM